MEVIFKHRSGLSEKRLEIIDLKTSNRYLAESMIVIAIKALGIFLIALPGYAMIYTALHLLRLPCTLIHFSTATTLKQVWTLVRIPFYFIALEFAALYAIFCPLDGRILFGALESAWHDGKSRSQLEQWQKPMNRLVWDFLFSKEHKSTVFVAPCMQPIGNLNDSHIKSYRPLQNSQAV